MKKPLRQVMDRAETSHREADLRDIGPTAILSDLPPLPYLFVKHSLGLPVAEITRRHCLHAREHAHGQLLHGKPSEYYKTMCVNLFVAALRVHHDHSNAELYLGHQDLLRATLVSNSHRFASPQDLEFHHLHVPDFGGPLTVSGLHQIVLHQAGIPIQVHEHDHRLEHPELADLYQNLVARFVQAQASFKASGG